MTLAIRGTAAPTAGFMPDSDRLRQQGAALKQLGTALKAGDIDGARGAYASLVRNASDDRSWDGGSPFADLGRALLKGDIAGAQSALQAMADARRNQRPGPGPTPEPAPAPAGGSSTGGPAGTTLNEVA